MKLKLEEIKFDERGLIPAIVQDAETREVLTLAYMNAESLRRTLEERETWFWSRSRSALWHKGETSGHTQRVRDVRVDCDADALVVEVEPAGPACHTGARSCFYREIENGLEWAEASSRKSDFDNFDSQLQKLYNIIVERRQKRPEGSYTTYLFNEGLDKILKKVGEESAETIIAAKNESNDALVSEMSDLIYHLVVLLVERGIMLAQVGDELAQRSGKRREA